MYPKEKIDLKKFFMVNCTNTKIIKTGIINYAQAG